MTYPRYPAYKDSGVEWLGLIPEHWEIVPIKYLVRMESGGTPDKANLEYWSGNIPWASAKDLKTEKLKDTENHISDKAVQDGVAHVIFEPSVLIVVRGMILAHTLPVTVNCVPTAINQDLKALHPNERLTVHFLSWLMRGLDDIFLARTDTAGHGTKALRTQDWNDIQLALPPLAEQRAIAAFLDAETARIDALAARQEALIATLQEKRRALIGHAVTRGLDPAAPMRDSGVAWLGEVPAHWEVKPIKYLVRMESGGTPDKSNLDYWDGTIPWASAKDLKVDLLQDTEDHITQHAIDRGAASLVAEESVIIVVRGMILLHTLPVTINLVPLAINQDLKALHPIEGMSSRFLAWSLRGLADAFLARTDTAGHGTKALRTEDWNDIELGVPPLEEQHAITSYIDQETAQIDALIAKSHSFTALLREQRAALVAAAVTGQIDVRG